MSWIEKIEVTNIRIKISDEDISNDVEVDLLHCLLGIWKTCYLTRLLLM